MWLLRERHYHHQREFAGKPSGELDSIELKQCDPGLSPINLNKLLCRSGGMIKIEEQEQVGDPYKYDGSTRHTSAFPRSLITG